MHEEQFPVFKDGQTLTHHELNDLRGYLDAQDHVLGRLIGFGISCGLDGEILNNQLVISPGLAIDQRGRPLMLDAAATISLPQQADASFDFLSGEGGFTPVLVAEDEDMDAPECDEEGCIGHASLRIRKATIRIGLGQIAQSSFSVSNTALAGVNPIVVAKSSTASNTGTAMVSALKRALEHRLSKSDLAQLDDAIISPSQDLPGIQAWKAAFLNRVFFATIDLLRCETLTQAACMRATETPGVAIGLLTVDGGPKWSCSPRHGFEPPVGLGTGLLGGDCEDGCGLLTARVRAMISTFSLPEVPAPDEGPKEPGRKPKICGPRLKSELREYAYTILSHADCIHLEVPPHYTIDPEKYVRVQPFPPPWEEPIDPLEVYELNHDILRVGTVMTATTLGQDVLDAEANIRSAILDRMGDTYPVAVMTVTPAERQRLAGYQPALEASLSDQIVLVSDTMGKVVEVGLVSVSETLNTIAPTVEAVKTEAHDATVAADDAAGLARAAVNDIAEVRTLSTELAGAVFGAGDGIGLLGTIDEMSSRLDTFAAGGPASVDYVHRAILESERSLDQQMATAAQEINDAVAVANANFRAEMTQRLDKAESRVDTVIFTYGKPPTKGLDVGSEYANAFRALQEVVRDTAGDDLSPEVAKSLHDSELAVARIDVSASMGERVEPEALLSAIEGLSGALKASGVQENQLKDVTTAVRNIRTGLKR